jgi:hypothetical protein
MANRVPRSLKPRPLRTPCRARDRLPSDTGSPPQSCGGGIGALRRLSVCCRTGLCTPKRKLENRHQRPEPETRPARAEMPEIADQRLGAPQPNLRECRRFSPHREITPQRPDSLADETVSREPVCGANSLLTGKLTGNFADSGTPPRFWRPVGQ